MISRGWRRGGGTNSTPRQTRPHRRFPRLESLEVRQLLTVVAVDDEFTVREDQFANPLEVLLNDEGTQLQIVRVTLPSSGGSLRLDADSNQLLYSPRHDFAGRETFEYVIADAAGDTDSASVTVSVENVNDLPTATADVFSLLQGHQPYELHVLTNDSTAPDQGEQLSILSVGTPSHGGSVSIVQQRVLLYTPADGFLGIEQFSYQITDGNGGTAQGAVEVRILLDESTIQAQDDRFELRTNGGEHRLDVLANDQSDSGHLVIVDVVAPEHGQVAIGDEGQFLVFAPEGNFAGVVQFQYTVADAQGNVDQATVHVFVQPLGGSPIANDDEFTVVAGTNNGPAILHVLNNDRSPSGLILSLLEVTQPDHGQVTIIPFGQVLAFVADPNFVGTTRFEYVVSDGHGGHDSATVIVHVVSNQQENRPPVARDDEFTVGPLDPTGVIRPLDVLANDETQAGETLRIIDVSQPEHGHVEFGAAGQQIFFVPDPDFVGSTRFEYLVSDGHGGQDSATVIVHVVSDQQENRPPVAHNDEFTVRPSSANNGQALDVLANDETEPGETLRIVEVSQPEHGHVHFGDAGQLILFAADPNFVGTTRFEYVVSDGRGGRDSAAVVVHVVGNQEENRPPVAHDDEFTVGPLDPTGVIRPLDVLANDETQAGETLRVVDVSQPEHGHVEFGVAGQQVFFVPDPDFVGSTRFEYVISDGRGGRDSAAVIVHVVGEDDPADINGDRDVSPLDILIMLNQMQRPNVPMEDDRDGDFLHFDVNGDGIFSLRDVLMVINRVNRRRFHAQIAANPVAANAVDVQPPSDEIVERPGMDEDAAPPPLPGVAPSRVDDRARRANAKVQPRRESNELEDILDDIQRDVAGQWNQ